MSRGLSSIRFRSFHTLRWLDMDNLDRRRSFNFLWLGCAQFGVLNCDGRHPSSPSLDKIVFHCSAAAAPSKLLNQLDSAVIGETFIDPDTIPCSESQHLGEP